MFCSQILFQLMLHMQGWLHETRTQVWHYPNPVWEGPRRQEPNRVAYPGFWQEFVHPRNLDTLKSYQRLHTLKALIFAGTNFRKNLFSQEKNREIHEKIFPRNILKIKNSRNFPQKLAVTWKYLKFSTPMYSWNLPTMFQWKRMTFKVLKVTLKYFKIKTFAKFLKISSRKNFSPQK